MAKRKTARQWRGFLRALAQTGNVRAAAAAAGMDVATAHNKKHRDPDFAAKWAAALETAREKGPLHRPVRKLGTGPELVLRTTKYGSQLVKAAPGRWNAAAEETFCGTLRRTGCVRRAAAACSLSTTTLYNRRDKYPDFAARWDRMVEEAKQRIPDLLSAAAIASLDPEAADPDLPLVDVKDAIAICRMKGWGGEGRRRRPVKPERPIEEVRASIMRKLDAIEAHEKRQAAKREEEGPSSSSRDA